MRRKTRPDTAKCPGKCGAFHGTYSGPSLVSRLMSIKYYTHFLLQERSPKGLSEFRGVVEVNRVLARGDLKEAASVLAKNFECETKDIKVLQWSRLHCALSISRSPSGLYYPSKVRFSAPSQKLGVFFLPGNFPLPRRVACVRLSPNLPAACRRPQLR